MKLFRPIPREICRGIQDVVDITDPVPLNNDGVPQLLSSFTLDLTDSACTNPS